MLANSLSFLRNGFRPSALPRLHIPQSFMSWLVCPPLPTNILLLAAFLEGSSGWSFTVSLKETLNMITNTISWSCQLHTILTCPCYWARYQTSDEEHNKTGFGKQVKCVAKKGVDSRLGIDFWGHFLYSIESVVQGFCDTNTWFEASRTNITDACSVYAMFSIITTFLQPCDFSSQFHCAVVSISVSLLLFRLPGHKWGTAVNFRNKLMAEV